MLARLPEWISEAFLPHPPETLGVAVSGGSDSMALLHLLHGFCLQHQIALYAVTVDHGLRAEAADEAAQVARQCAALGVPHDTLHWDDWNGEGNLQKAARDARYQRMAIWATTRDIAAIAVGHTADDQAETVLMRLARRSGVDGLSAMQRSTYRDGITWVRPLLPARRETLRDYLRHHDITWSDDPSNENEKYERIKARKTLDLLAPLGIDVEGLGDVAKYMSHARTALNWQTFLSAKELANTQAGAVVLDEKKFSVLPDEIQRRMTVKAINWITGNTYAPRSATLTSLRASMLKNQAATLAGCQIRRIGTAIWVFREHNTVCNTLCTLDVLWDGRWKLTQCQPEGHDPDLVVGVLGQNGLEQCPDWRATGIPYVVLLSTPAIWKGDELIAAPLAGYPQNWRAEAGEIADSFFASLLSH